MDSNLYNVLDWRNDQALHTISVYANPMRSQNRARAFDNFIRHVSASPDVKLYVVEIAYGDRPFELDLPSSVNVLRLRSHDVLWIKENAINIAVQRMLPKGAKYAAYVDADLHFGRRDWAIEAVHQLQLHAWVQLFSGYAFMTPDCRPVDCRPGFAYVWRQIMHCDLSIAEKFVKNGAAADSQYRSYGGPALGAVGGAWAWRMDKWPSDGFIDFAILGSADIFHVLGLVNYPVDGREEVSLCSREYAQAIAAAAAELYGLVCGNVGYVANFALHEWHGDWADRGYDTRWQILRDNDFDPRTDLVHDSQGLVQFAGNKPQLELAVKNYFASRNEDGTHLTRSAMY